MQLNSKNEHLHIEIFIIWHENNNFFVFLYKKVFKLIYYRLRHTVCDKKSYQQKFKKKCLSFRF
jgi:hypothetical protein